MTRLSNTLQGILRSFREGVTIRRPATPLKRYSAWNIDGGTIARVESLAGEQQGSSSVHRVSNPESGEVAGGVVMFPPVYVIVDRLGEDAEGIGYLYSNGWASACYDLSGGRPILYGDHVSMVRDGILNMEPVNPIDLGTKLKVELEFGVAEGSQFRSLVGSSLTDAPPQALFRFTAQEGGKRSEIGFALWQNLSVEEVMQGQADFFQPVFNLTAFLRFDMKSARLVGLVDRHPMDRGC
jgi:hypothetical protein